MQPTPTPADRRSADDHAVTPTSYLRTIPGSHPRQDDPTYRSTRLRHPTQPLVYLPHTVTEITGPQLGPLRVTGEHDNDLTRQHPEPPVGERLVIFGAVRDTEGRPIRDTLVEIWQANAAGRYRHSRDRWPAPLDPNFSGGGRCVTDQDGRYSFTTIKPGAYPWGNHYNAWRPAHVHFSLLGRAFAHRLVTQMYFPGDPLLRYDPIFNAVPDAQARERLVSRFDISKTIPEWAQAFEFDIVLRGPGATPFEDVVR